VPEVEKERVGQSRLAAVEEQMGFEHDVVVVGGCGHVGLPLGISFASRGLRVVLHDVNSEAVDIVSRGEMPFLEAGADEELRKAVGVTLIATTEPAVVSHAEHIVVVIGTPVDEHLNPDPNVVLHLVQQLGPHLVDGQHLVLRSTVFPGTTALVERTIADMGRQIDVTYCPERIAEGHAMTELFELPQLISGRTDTALDRAAKLFGCLTDTTIRLVPEEAELAKLFANTWRYIKFATANQMYVMADTLGLDYERIRTAMRQDYPRAADLPRAGFAAGPCLMKDTLQLAALTRNNFPLGHAAMLMNEGLPLYLVERLEQRFPLRDMTVGILGMAFKSESDDIRSSLSYKLKRVLRFKARSVLCHDPYVTSDGNLSPLAEVLEHADLLVIGAPHRVYESISFDGPVLDIWGLLESESL
jgi:UDP-N-acetyl-D-mannosaminuronic acid dehydrogenase